MPNSGPKLSLSLTSSPRHSATGYFWEIPHGKYDIHRSVFISRRNLTIFRVFFAIYSLISIFLILAHCKDYNSLFQISRCTFVLQTIYFIQAAQQSLSGKPAREEESDWKVIHILYEVSFSFQLFNFVYYWISLLPGQVDWQSNFLDCLVEFHLNVIAFVIIWCDQLFNLMRLYPRHIWVVVVAALANLCTIHLLTNEYDIIVYKDVNFSTFRGAFTWLLMFILPVAHFVAGYKHSDYKRKIKNTRRKYLGEQLVCSKKVSH